MGCYPTSARPARDNQHPSLIPDGSPRTRAHPDWPSDWGQGTHPGTRSPHWLSRESGSCPACHPAIGRAGEALVGWYQGTRPAPVPSQEWLACSRTCQEPGSNCFVSLAEVGSSQTCGLGKLPVLVLPEASSGSLGQILAEPPFPGLQNGRREGSWELMACEIPPNSDITILLLKKNTFLKNSFIKL